MEKWLTDLNLSQYFENFENEGYEDIEVIEACIDEAKLKNIGIWKQGHRDKILLDITKRRANKTTESECKVVLEEHTEDATTSSQSAPWERERLGFIPHPRGDRTLYYNSILPDFYESACSRLTSDDRFRATFVAERKRQYDFIINKNNINAALQSILAEKMLGSNKSPRCGDIRTVSFVLKRILKIESQIDILHQSLKAHDKTLYQENGRRLKATYFGFAHKFNTTQMEQVKDMDTKLNDAKTELSKLDSNLKSTFQGIKYLGIRRESRKKKENRRKVHKRKDKRKSVFLSRTLKTLVPQYTSISDEELVEGLKTGHIHNIQMVYTEELQFVTKKTLNGILQLISYGAFSDSLVRYISNSLPDCLQGIYIDALSSKCCDDESPDDISMQYSASDSHSTCSSEADALYNSENDDTCDTYHTLGLVQLDSLSMDSQDMSEMDEQESDLCDLSELEYNTSENSE